MRKRFYLLPVFLGLTSLVLTIPLVVIKLTGGQTQTFKTEATQTYTTVSLFPQKATYKMAAAIPAGVLYESNDQKIKTVDVVITYDPSLVEVTAVSRGIILDNYKTMKFDNKLGQITIFGENTEEKAVNGILASIKFRPLKPGVVKFTFATGTTAQKMYGGEFIITQ